MLHSFEQQIKRQVNLKNEPAKRNIQLNFYFFLIFLKNSTDETLEFKEEICFIFSLKEKIGALVNALKIFEVCFSLDLFLKNLRVFKRNINRR